MMTMMRECFSYLDLATSAESSTGTFQSCRILRSLSQSEELSVEVCSGLGVGKEIGHGVCVFSGVGTSVAFGRSPFLSSTSTVLLLCSRLCYLSVFPALCWLVDIVDVSNSVTKFLVCY
jgi:hypothetical protein